MVISPQISMVRTEVAVMLYLFRHDGEVITYFIFQHQWPNDQHLTQKERISVMTFNYECMALFQCFNFHQMYLTKM